MLLPRQGTQPPKTLMSATDSSTCERTIGTGAGLGSMLDDPYRACLDPAVSAAMMARLAAVRGPPVHLGPAQRAPSLVLPNGCVESPWQGTVGGLLLSGVVCRPARPGPLAHRWTIFYNAGGVRRCGPNRLWTRAARQLAAQGQPSLRLDVHDVGDSDGTHVPHRDLEAMYSPASVLDALAAYDAVVGLGAQEVDVVGLCSGAFLSMQVAAQRPVRRACLFNGLAYVWDDNARASKFTAHIRGSLFNLRRWRRLLTGRIDGMALARSVVKKGRLKARDRLDQLRGRPVRSAVATLIAHVQAQGTDVHLVSSAGDPSVAYLQEHFAAQPMPQLTVLTGLDHTLRPVWSHDQIGPDLHPELPLNGACMNTEKVLEIVLAHGRLQADPSTITDTTDLYAAGLSSLTTVHLMLALEDAFDVEFPDELLSRRTFESVLSIAEAIDELVH